MILSDEAALHRTLNEFMKHSHAERNHHSPDKHLIAPEFDTVSVCFVVVQLHRRDGFPHDSRPGDGLR